MSAKNENMRSHHAISSNVVQRYWRPLRWSGYDWRVRQHKTALAPGPNWWSSIPEQVSVDLATDVLSLSIIQRGGVFYCSEIQGPQLGYGTYRWHVRTNMTNLDAQEVLGLFVYDPTAPTLGYREIDIEFSKWGNVTSPQQLWYSVQPTPGFNHRRSEHTMDGISGPYICEFTWQPGFVYFKTTNVSGALLGEHAVIDGVQVPGNEVLSINYWLRQGLPLTGVTKSTIELTRFEFIKNATVTLPASATKSLTFSPANHSLSCRINSRMIATGVQLDCVHSSATYALAFTGGVFNVQGSSVDIKIVSLPAIGNNTTQAMFELYYDAQNFVSIIRAGTGITASITNAGVVTNVSKGYVQTNLYWRISESAGVFTLQHSANRSTWTTIATLPHTFGAKLGVMRVRLKCGYYGSETSPGSFVVAGVNIT